MKTPVLSSAVWGAILFFTCSLSLPAIPPGDYMYDTKEENGKIVSKTIFLQKEGLLDRQLKYDFKYGEDGKVTEKKACRWNSSKNDWEPFYLIAYRYDREKGAIHSEYAMWDRKTKDYTLNVQTIVLPEDSYEEIFQ
jgi:hypothetical protein